MSELHGTIDLIARDHNRVYAVRKQPKIKKSYKFMWDRTYHYFDALLLKRDVLSHDWSNVLDEGDVNMAWDNFTNSLIKIVDQHAPFKRLVSDSLPKWVTIEYMQA